jgi:hypothetical protein
MVFALTAEKKAIEKLAPVISDKWAIRTKGDARRETPWVQFRDSIRLPIIRPRETKNTSLIMGQANPCQSIIIKSGCSMLLHQYNTFALTEYLKNLFQLNLLKCAD